MQHRSIQEIHIDSLALAAGVMPPPHLSVSHAPAYPRPPKRRIRRFYRWVLRQLNTLFNRVEECVERDHLNECTAR